MLFTDGDFVTSAGLSVIDGEIAQNVIANSKLTLDGPGSIIRRSIEECGAILTAKFQSYSGYLVGSGTSAHNFAVNYTGGNNAINRPRFHLFQVVAVEPDPNKVQLRHWVEYKALAAIFRAVFRRFSGKDNDRYATKVNDYDAEAAKAAIRLWAAGVPVITASGPLDAPGAIRQLGAGIFDSSAVTHSGSGSTDPGNAWYVAITWVGSAYASPTVKGNAESAGSAVVEVTTNAAEHISVSIAGLTPPSGAMTAIGLSDGIYPPMAATGWNVYVGSSASILHLQNATPIPVGTLSYSLANAPVLSGALLQPGQFSTASYAMQNVVMRG